VAAGVLLLLGLLGGGLLLGPSDSVVDPAAAISDAAQGTVDLGSFRAILVTTDPDGTVERSLGEFRGDRVRVSWTGDEGPASYTAIGPTIWTTTSEGTTSEHIPPEGRLAPCAESCEAVLAAALEEGSVEDLGDEQAFARRQRALAYYLRSMHTE
jgi:hypothetical protein